MPWSRAGPGLKIGRFHKDLDRRSPVRACETSVARQEICGLADANGFVRYPPMSHARGENSAFTAALDLSPRGEHGSLISGENRAPHGIN